ncbi:hypothetical protein [Flavobacterium sp. AG291]|uniref:hypothetical protein n=1 Tax=Flavobacterium sp. AG291 TaxID=2184000 RepID=UPI000E2CB3BD|nr:hypothetical protein [Flavobacterium sp. AG291]RDI06661.1 hypothetical protein DEU42_1146 [Flavobacterium sp. AG291]
MKNLEKKFIVNEIKRQPDKARIKTSIDSVFLNGKIIILPQLLRQLQKEGVDTVLRQNAEGLVYGVTFVDHKTKSVFNGSSIGKDYSAKGLQDMLVMKQEKVGQEIDYSRKELTDVLHEHSASMGIKGLTNFLDILMRVENNFDDVYKELKRRRTKRSQR